MKTLQNVTGNAGKQPARICENRNASCNRTGENIVPCAFFALHCATALQHAGGKHEKKSSHKLFTSKMTEDLFNERKRYKITKSEFKAMMQTDGEAYGYITTDNDECYHLHDVIGFCFESAEILAEVTAIEKHKTFRTLYVEPLIIII
jgi:hypothetical protein